MKVKIVFNKTKAAFATKKPLYDVSEDSTHSEIFEVKSYGKL